MEYITLVKQFYHLAEVNNLSTGQIALWHALVYINNKCYWTEYFSVPNITLQLYTGLSRQGIIKSRNALKQKGLIDFTEGKRGQASSYKITIMSNSVHNCIQKVDKSVYTKLTNPYTNSLHKSSALIDNKTKDNYIINPIIPFQDKLGESVSEWLRYKSELGQTYTPTGQKALFAKIQKAADEIGETSVIAAISKSISNGWKGIYFDDKRASKEKLDDGYDHSQLEEIIRSR